MRAFASAARPIGAGACLLAFAACAVEDGQWYPPRGTALGEIDCTSPAPLQGLTGREICLARVIEDRPEAIARCKRDGGRTGPVSVVDRRFACDYRIGAPVSAGGDESDMKPGSGMRQ